MSSFASNRSIKLWTCCECRKKDISMTVGDCPNCQHPRCIYCDVKGHVATDAEIEEENMKIARSAGQVRAGAAQAPLPRPSQRRGDGVVIWNFRAELDDDITVFAGEEVTILDTTSNEGRWKVRRLRDGAEGIMPGSRIEVFGTVSDIGISYLNPSRLTNEQDRHSSQLAESSQGSNQPESSSFQERGRSIIAVVIPNTIENSANAPRLDSRSVPKTYDASNIETQPPLTNLAYETEKLPIYVLREDSDAALISAWHDALPMMSSQCSTLCKYLVSMHLFRVGLSESSSTPTIIINTSEPLGRQEETSLQNVISHGSRQLQLGFFPSIRVSFRTSWFRRSVGSQLSPSIPPLPPVCRPRNSQFSRTPQTGASIGILGSVQDTATLGCYLLMTGKPMVLTVDHLAPNPSMDEFITHISEQDRCDFMMPVLEEELHRLVGLTDHLCELCLNRRLPRGLISGVILRGDLLQGISTQSCPVYQGLLAKCLSYEAAKYQMKPMAKKYAQSGRRSRLVSGTADAWEVRREMDWALYEVLDDSIYYLKDRLAVQDTPGPQRPNELKVSLEVKPGALIKSLGRTSGHQLGQISTTSSTIFQGSYMTSEWCVLKRPETELQDWIEGGIGVDGDSGGLVIDEEDNAVYGMLWGRSGDGPATVTIFTPLMEILRDIRDRVGDHASFLGGQQMPNSGDIDPPDLVESVPITVRISEKEQKAPLEESLPPPGIRRQSSAETGHPRPFERYRGGHRTTQSSRQTIPQPEREEEKMEKSQWPGAHTYLRYAVADDQE